MSSRESFLDKYYSYIIALICAVAVFFLQYVFRSFDDNRLTSWAWTFVNVDLSWFMPGLIIGTILVYTVFRSPFAVQRPLLFLSISSFAVSTIFWKTPEVILDASRYFTQAKHLSTFGAGYFLKEWGMGISAWTDLPLIPFMYGLLFKFFGESRAYIQILTSSLFSMTVVLTCLTGRALWDEDTGFYAGAMLLGIPYLYSQIPLMLVDVPTMFFLTLSIFTFIKAMKSGGGWILFSAVAIFCTAFSKYSTWMMLSVLAIIFLVYAAPGRGNRRGTGTGKRVLYRGALIAIVAGTLIGSVFFLKYDVMAGQMAFLREYQAPGLKRWGESFVSTFLYQVHPFITIAAVVSFFVAFIKRDAKFLIISFPVLLLLVLQIQRSRYLMVAFPMLAIMASYGFQRIINLDLRKFIASSIIASAAAVAIFAYLPFLQSLSMVNFREAGEFIDSINGAKIDVYTVQSDSTSVNIAVTIPLLDLFTTKDIQYHYDAGSAVPADDISESPLRFTWEFANPLYYEVEKMPSANEPAVVIISNSPEAGIPESAMAAITGYKKEKVFNSTSGIFRFSPVVTIYLPE
jgi:hypothetical protein